MLATSTTQTTALDANSKVILVTGANGGIGYAVAQHICEWASHHQQGDNQPPFPADRLILILACRNPERAKQAQSALMQAYGGNGVKEENCTKSSTTTRRITIDVALMDLSSCASVMSACKDIKERYKKVDYLILNAGIIPIKGISLQRGLHNLIHRPALMAKTGGDVIEQFIGEVTEEGGLGKTFASNFFGHFILAKGLEALLNASGDGRVLWFTSTTALPEFFDALDPQCLKGDHPYESSKRLCEIISTALDHYWKKQHLSIRSILISPGNCFSNITQGSLHQSVMLAAMYAMRYIGCSGMNISTRNGTTSTMYILQLNAEEASSLPDAAIIYHSEIDVWGQTSCRMLKSPPARESEQLFEEMLSLYHQKMTLK